MMTRDEIDALELEIRALQKQLDLKGTKLRLARTHCLHCWSPVKWDPIYEEAYTIPADPPGTMGVDWTPEIHVPSKTTRRWTRACEACGMVQHTGRTRKGSGAVPGTSGEIPDFS